MTPQDFLSQFDYRLSGTGSRSLHTADLDHIKDVWRWVYRRVQELQATHGKVVIITGMAQGFDTCLASVAKRQQIPYLCAIPNPGYGTYYWRRHSVTGKSQYRDFKAYLDAADYVHYVCDDHKWGKANFIRNQWMVDHADEFLVYKPQSAGTADCLERVEAQNLPYRIYGEGS